MYRYLSLLLLSAAALPAHTQPAGTAAAAHASFDLGTSAGLIMPTRWFSGDGESYSIGTAPVFGIQAAYRVSPAWSVRAGGAYAPSGLPGEFDGRIDNWMYDVTAVVRPWHGRGSDDRVGSAYLLLGAGSYTGRVRSTAEPVHPVGCVSALDYIRMGMCVSTGFDRATVGQVHLGGGIDLAPLGSRSALFVEGSVYGHASPAHKVAAAGSGTDAFVFSPRLGLGVRTGF
jgi:hypothetical protein